MCYNKKMRKLFPPFSAFIAAFFLLSPLYPGQLQNIDEFISNFQSSLEQLDIPAYVSAFSPQIQKNEEERIRAKLDRLKADKVYVFGAHKSIKLGIPNEEAAGVIPAMEFLTRVSLGYETDIGTRVGVIGGGNSAVDAARVANRLPQVKEVTIIYRRTRNEMPAYVEEIEAALEEGINIQFLTAPTDIIIKDDHISGVRCARMELGTVDASGRRRPIPIKGSDFVVELDTLVSAISEQPDISFLKQDHDFEISGWNTFVVDNETLATNIPGIFAGGDAIRGPSSVVEAMADGKKVATAIDQYLRNQEIEFEYKVTRPSLYVEPVKLTVKETLESTRQETKKLSPDKRAKNFNEVDLGFNKGAAIKEAKRCLRCDLEVKSEDEKEQK